MAKPARSPEDWDIISRSVAGRQKVHDLVRSDPGIALAAARGIPSGWYRVQSLAQVARYAPSRIAAVALDECGPSARTCTDSYQQSAVLAWPIRAALETDRAEVARAHFEEALAQLPNIELFASRAEAISLLFQAVTLAGCDLGRMILRELPAICPPDAHWRSARLYRNIAAILAGIDPGQARAFIGRMPSGKIRDATQKRFEAGERFGPRTFF